ncbi:MAG: RluA family pseudouridine synthase [Eubacterium sp.]|nr:RluA family pseudouridine synthase [Eubacterium sp.]
MSNIFIVDEELQDIRIDKYLGGLLADSSRTYIQKLIKENNILVNDKACKANYKVQAEDKITVDIPEPVYADIEPENIPLDIIYEDNDVLIVNKPKNLVVHPAPGHYSGTLVNAIMYHCKDNLSNINGVLRPGIVHRIDKDTTGALIVCKNDFSHNFIANQLKEHSITRKYIGIVQGVLKDSEGIIDAPVGRHPVKRKEMCINETNGKNAITHYKVLKQFSKYTLCEFQLETGRTHQIRVHMASINHPLLGDEIYNHNKCPYKLQGQCLHAKTIGFIHPATKEYVEFEADIPAYFDNLIEKVLI